MKETYKEMKKRHARELRALPIRYAFSTKQLAEILEEWGCTRSEVCSVWGIGDIVRKVDADAVRAYQPRVLAETRDAMTADPRFLREAFITEMWNHECEIGDYTDALRPFGITWEDLDKNPETRDEFNAAREEYAAAFAALGW